MNAGARIDQIEFSTASVESRFRTDAFRDALPFELSTLTPDNEYHTELSARFNCWTFNGVTLGKGFSSPFSATRARSKLIDNRVIDVTKTYPGYQRFGQDGRYYRVPPGGVNILDGSKWENVRINGPIESVFANVHHDVIGFEPKKNQSNSVLGEPLGSPAFEIIDANLELLARFLPTADAEHASMLTSVFAGVLRALVRGGSLDDFSYDMLQQGGAVAIQRYVDRHFGRFNLTVDEICTACGMSRATVYRVFAEHGGLVRYVMAKRLQVAYDQLAASAPRRGLIRQVAEGWGFSDQAHFARLFRERFGVSPSDVVGSAIPDIDDRFNH